MATVFYSAQRNRTALVSNLESSQTVLLNHPLHDPPIRRRCLSLVRCSLHSYVSFAFGKLIGFCVRTSTVETMLRRILQMVSFWGDRVNRIAFVWLNRVVFLGRHGAYPCLFSWWNARFKSPCVAGGRGSYVPPNGRYSFGKVPLTRQIVVNISSAPQGGLTQLATNANLVRLIDATFDSDVATC